MIYVVGSSKGGAGKSTFAGNFAACLATLLRRDVLLVDTDKDQPSSTLWASLRAANGTAADCAPLSSVPLSAANLVHEVRRLTRKFDDIVIDAGGHDSAELRAALLVADAVITPVAPDLFDIAAMKTDSMLLTTAREFNPQLAAFAVINNASTNHQETGTRDLREQLALLAPNFVVLDAWLKRRAAYGNAKVEGLGVVEMKPVDKAGREMLAVFNELIERLT